MSAVILGRGFFYGIPKELPAIEGYEIIVNHKDWLMARKDVADYYVLNHPDKWELLEKGYNLKFVSNDNPDGHFVHTDKPIFIQK